MLIIGLAGQAGVGKDTIADYLVQHYGFVKFAFSDGLYWEVQRAFGLEDQTLLRDRATKEEPSERLALKHCTDKDFVAVARRMIAELHPDTFFVLENVELSPRQVLQWWGTDYRRAQNDNYWIKLTAAFIEQMHFHPPYPELRPSLFVEVGTRFENERGWIKSMGGNIWHVHRGDETQKHAHVSAVPLPVLDYEREIFNNGTVDQLHEAIDMLFNTAARFVSVEPEDGPNEPPAGDARPPVLHASDCSTNNEPAYPAGECDCGAVARTIDGPQAER